MRSLEWALTQYKCVLMEGGLGHTHIGTREDYVKRVIYKPRRGPWKKSTLPTPLFQASSLQNHEISDVDCLSDKTYLLVYQFAIYVRDGLTTTA